MLKKNKSIFTFFLCVSALCLALSACSGGKEDDGGEMTDAITEESFSPVTDNGDMSAGFNDYTEWKENASLVFKDNAPLGAGSFEYEVKDGEVTIKKYIGDEIVAVIPESIDGAAVTEIAEGAFSGGSIRAVYVPDSVISIAKKAFDSCEGLSTLRLPFIGDGSENAYLGYIFGADEPDENAVAIPQSFKMVIVGERCKSISDEAFRRVKSLKAVVFEGDIENVGRLAFYECAELSYITLDMVKGNIGELAFAFCRALYSADVSNSERVESGAFYSCSTIHDMSLSFGENDFLGRYFGAETADFNDEFVPASLREISVGEDCKKIPDRAFASCRYLTSVKLPVTLESIGIRAFYSCRSLCEIDIPDSVSVIGEDAFFNCDALKSVKLGNGILEIRMQAFFGCKAISEIEIPNTLEKIGASAFYGCESLENVKFNGHEEIGKDAFGNCPKLDADK